MSQWSVRVRVVRTEIWTVEAETGAEDEALYKAAMCDTVDEQDCELVDWEPISATEDK